MTHLDTNPGTIVTECCGHTTDMCDGFYDRPMVGRIKHVFHGEEQPLNVTESA